MEALKPRSGPPVDILRIDPKILAHILSLRGAERRSFRNAFHAVFDVQVAQWQERISFTRLDPKRGRRIEQMVEGTSLRVRLRDAKGVTVDIVGQGGFLSDDEIILDHILPGQVLSACIGRTSADILGDAKGRFDGSRRIIKSSIRFNSTTVLGLEKIEKNGIGYRELIGAKPQDRFPEQRERSVSIGSR